MTTLAAPGAGRPHDDTSHALQLPVIPSRRRLGLRRLLPAMAPWRVHCDQPGGGSAYDGSRRNGLAEARRAASSAPARVEVDAQ
jgi:hypothetical protein